MPGDHLLDGAQPDPGPAHRGYGAEYAVWRPPLGAPPATAARSLSVLASLLRSAGVLSFMIEQLFVRVSALVVVRALRRPGDRAREPDRRELSVDPRTVSASR
jgi:hypothetical protein